MKSKKMILQSILFMMIGFLALQMQVKAQGLINLLEKTKTAIADSVIAHNDLNDDVLSGKIKKVKVAPMLIFRPLSTDMIHYDPQLYLQKWETDQFYWGYNSVIYKDTLYVYPKQLFSDHETKFNDTYDGSNGDIGVFLDIIIKQINAASGNSSNFFYLNLSLLNGLEKTPIAYFSGEKVMIGNENGSSFSHIVEFIKNTFGTVETFIERFREKSIETSVKSSLTISECHRVVASDYRFYKGEDSLEKKLILQYFLSELDSISHLDNNQKNWLINNIADSGNRFQIQCNADYFEVCLFGEDILELLDQALTDNQFFAYIKSINIFWTRYFSAVSKLKEYYSKEENRTMHPDFIEGRILEIIKKESRN